MEYWTEDGLSAVTSGIGTPLYTDKIMKNCLRLDFARVCVMLDYHSKLPKHLVVLSPILSEGKESLLKVDIEYEWLPLRCKQCCSLGHNAPACPDTKVKKQAVPVAVYVQKQQSTSVDSFHKRDEVADTRAKWRGRLSELDYCRIDPGLRIILGWEGESGLLGLEVVVEVIMTDEQFIHCSLLNKQTSTKCLLSVVYGDCDSIRRRLLLGGLLTLSEGISDVLWCVLGDFNAVIDSSESCGRVAKANNAMAEFREFITEAALVHLPFTGCPFTWHNCSEGSRGLWKHLDRILVNEVWQPGFLNAMRGVWRHHIYGNQMYGVVCKLKALKSTFRAQRKIKGDLSNNVCLAKEFLEKAKGLFDMFKEDILLQLPHLKHILAIEEANELIIPVTQAEIKEAFFDISEDSAPEPDGYTSAFFKAAWPEIGNDICAAVTEFFASGRLLKQLNAMLLLLIPKVQLPIRVSEFRPIACCNVVYKAISKIPVRRMQQVLHMLIDYSQNAFVLGRSIADNVLLAQELLPGYNQVRLPQR
ncbi:UNVERIFIED_CONTAM: hypothetical protein Sradi_1778700 [Sesamum radiatum]|uniref:Reverse transcriptase domain-containing protein n=1 Tax=Sesamum radiatum TaxID=300843 RepID=A0AAW2TV79_SESRA